MKNNDILSETIKTFIIQGKDYFLNKFPYLSYLYDKSKHTTKNITYYNFWKTKNFRISEFIKYRKISDKPIDFISVFWPRTVVKYLKNKKIFFTWEDIGKNSIHWLLDYDDYLLDDVDLSIWFREYNNKNNYIRFPLYIIYLIDPRMEYNDIKNRIDEINNRIINNRDNFCCLIARHDKSWERELIYKRLKNIWAIDCPSSFMHNLDIDLPNRDSKRDFLKKYRFNICIENHSVKWYVTEKLIDSFRSKCIPIYNWILTDFDKKIINEDAFINTLNKNWVNLVEEIYLNDKKYREFISRKPFKKDAALIIDQHLNLLEWKLRDVLKY